VEEGQRVQGVAVGVRWGDTDTGPVHVVEGDGLELTVVALDGRGWERPEGGACVPSAVSVEHEVEEDVVRLRVVDRVECGDGLSGGLLSEVPLEVRLPALPAGRYTLEVDNGDYGEAPEPRALYVGPACEALGRGEVLAGTWDWVGGTVEFEGQEVALLDSAACAAVGYDQVFSALTVLPSGFFVGTVHTDFNQEEAGCLQLDDGMGRLQTQGGERDAVVRFDGRRLVVRTTGRVVVAEEPAACGVWEMSSGNEEGERWLEAAEMELVYARPEPVVEGGS